MDVAQESVGRLETEQEINRNERWADRLSSTERRIRGSVNKWSWSSELKRDRWEVAGTSGPAWRAPGWGTELISRGNGKTWTSWSQLWVTALTQSKKKEEKLQKAAGEEKAAVPWRSLRLEQMENQGRTSSEKETRSRKELDPEGVSEDEAGGEAARSSSRCLSSLFTLPLM